MNYIYFNLITKGAFSGNALAKPIFASIAKQNTSSDWADMVITIWMDGYALSNVPAVLIIYLKR